MSRGADRPAASPCSSSPRPSLVAEVARLAAAEQDCCTFFTFTLPMTTGQVRLEVQAPDDAADDRRGDVRHRCLTPHLDSRPAPARFRPRSAVPAPTKETP